jgi:putative PIG3 family NAD(P)H quinone oxidoreductase
MTAIEITEPGGPEVLQPVSRAVPSPAAGEVLIKVVGAGINRPDVFQRKGAYPPPPGAPDIPGLEVSGTIATVGTGVTSWQEGDAVCALVAGGGYAEYCAAPVEQVLPIPEGIEVADAAALPETFFTVWTNVFDRAALRSGETLLIHGGSSGIGTTAIQLAKNLGSTVFATAGSPEKCALCENLGASKAINYRDEDFEEAIKEVTNKRGVDVILDMVAGDYVARNIRLLAPEGRLVFIAFLNGSKAEVDFNRVMRHRLKIMGSTLRPQSIAAKGKIAEHLKKTVWPLLDSGAVRPIIDSRFPLSDAAGAHALMESSAHMGKILLTI